MPPTPSQRLYEMGRKHRESEEQPITLFKHLEQPESKTKIRPVGRTVEQSEIEGWFNQIVAANSWFALTPRNVDIITKIFLFDGRLSHMHTVEDFARAFKIANAEHRLDQNAPPPKPQFESSIESWQLPMPSPAWALRTASKEALADYIKRAKEYEIWLAEQDQ
jgi:hypothetical protein